MADLTTDQQGTQQNSPKYAITPSGWDYVDAIMDSITPALIVGTLSAIAYVVYTASNPASVAIQAATAGAPTIVFLMQFGSYIRGIYRGTIKSTTQ